MRSAIAWEQYTSAREQLQSRIADKIRRQMSTLIGDMDSADLLLVAADGKKLAAHECILRTRAPGFYQRHVEATINAMGPRKDGKMREVAIGDIDSAGLEFFINSVYTEDEIARIPMEPGDRQESSSRASNRSYAMDESTTELDFQMSGVEDRQEDETPTLTGRPPLAPYPQSGMGSYPNSPKRFPMIPAAMSYSAGPYPMMHTPYGMMIPGPYPMMGGQFAQMIATNSAPSVPVMTSFRDLASGSPMNSSIYSLGGRSEVADIPEEDEEAPPEEKKPKPHPEQRSIGKFIRLDSSNGNAESHKEFLDRKRSGGGTRQMFPMFIGLSDSDNLDRENHRTGQRLSLSKRMSMTSLTSLTSIDLTPGQDGAPPIGDMKACSKLAQDLMQMYIDNEDTDCVIRTEGGDLHAHKCILSATCPFFRQQLQTSKRVELRGFTKNSINFLLMFLYGGVTSIPDDVDLWELVSLATHLNHKDLAEVVILHLKATKCHWFHRPCASCVSAVFDCLPQLASIRCLRPLYDEAMQWQAKHFSRVWKGRVFLFLNERWQKEAYEAVIQHMDDESVIDIILSCERLQVSLARSKSDSAMSVLGMVDDILDVAMQFLVHSFHLVVTSKAFQQHGKGLALNLSLLEDLLPTVVHSLSADVAIKTFKGLASLWEDIQKSIPSPKKALSIPVDDWSPKFSALIKRLLDLSDRHLLHYAASVVRAEAYHLLTDEQKKRIEETGIFVELRQPKAPPPKLSSHARSYKRSASAGVHTNSSVGDGRARSAERPRPLSIIQSTTSVSSNGNDDDLKKEEVVPKPDIIEDEKNENEKKEVKSQLKSSKLPSPTRSRSRHDRSKSKEKKAPEPTPKVEPEIVKSELRSRDPIRRSPIKKKPVEVEESRMERQGTHTVINVDKARAATLPGPDSSPIKTSEKPKSVVKPMVKDNPLAASANRTITRDRASQRKVETKPVRSAIPMVTKPSSRPTPTRPVEKQPAAKTIEKPRVLRSNKPVPTKKTTNSIEK